MRPENVDIKDIAFMPDFLNDYEHASFQVKRAMDKLVRMMLDSGRFPNSMNVHAAESLLNLYIGYVTRTKTHWRALFYIDKSRITFYRLAGHDRMNVILKELVK